jgi:hypothetical protein
MLNLYGNQFVQVDLDVLKCIPNLKWGLPFKPKLDGLKLYYFKSFFFEKYTIYKIFSKVL